MRYCAWVLRTPRASEIGGELGWAPRIFPPRPEQDNSVRIVRLLDSESGECTIATWKQSKCPSLDEWINKIW